MIRGLTKDKNWCIQNHIPIMDLDKDKQEKIIRNIQHVRVLNKYINLEKNKVKSNFYVHRYVNFSDIKNYYFSADVLKAFEDEPVFDSEDCYKIVDLSNTEKPNIKTDRGFKSTCMTRFGTRDFGNIELKIKVPKGFQKGIDIYDQCPEQDEFLMSNNAQFQFMSAIIDETANSEGILFTISLLTE